jgi:hypothetical protein
LSVFRPIPSKCNEYFVRFRTSSKQMQWIFCSFSDQFQASAMNILSVFRPIPSKCDEHFVRFQTNSKQVRCYGSEIRMSRVGVVRNVLREWLESRALRRISTHKGEEIRGRWKWPHNGNLSNLHSWLISQHITTLQFISLVQKNEPSL